ncbi:MAG: DUF362 domain-containing protein [Deltaproteobacteria bacterium]|nr:DUF362 domain-containing protein [Deltaproteobacteria bacterium]
MLAAGGAGLTEGGHAVPEAAAAPGAGVKVAVASGAAPSENVARAVAALGGIKAFVSRGDVVVLKPNIGWDRTPEQAANTNPEVVVALAEMCLSAGAKEVRVFDRTCNDPRRCYVNSGIQAAVEAFAKKRGASGVVRVYHVEDRKFRRTAIPGAFALKEWDLYRDALEADKIVNVPVAKHHTLATATLGLKNMMGIMGGNRGQIHYNLSDCLVDIHRRLPTSLTVIDATRVLLRNGPSGGNLADVRALGKVFASPDVVAADVVAAERVFGWKPSDVAHIRKALDAKLGVSSPAQIRVVEA